MLGLAYQGLPDAKAGIENQRHQDPYADKSFWMKNYRATPAAGAGDYWSSLLGGVPTDFSARKGQPPFDPTETTPQLFPPDASDEVWAAYPQSFKQNWKPPYTRQAAYRPSPVLHNEYGDDIGPMGPNLPRGPVGTSKDPEMPYLGPLYPPISPGDPGWTPPPSPSGPHNRAGDVPRPGYDRQILPTDIMGTTLNSNPWGY